MTVANEASGVPTPAIALEARATEVAARLAARRVELDDVFLRQLRDVCADVTTADDAVVESSRDWWPITIVWALDNRIGQRAGVVARPRSADEVADVLRACHERRVPVTAAGGRSGVCGGNVPVHGGVLLDVCALSGVVDVDDVSMVLDVQAGTFGTWLEARLRADHGATLGHWPQSIDLSTVGGWLACRSAGQLSTRYGKIEDMVVGLDVALADGRRITTGGAPRAAVGPDLTQLFVGSEGTLGVITGSRLRLHPAPVAERRAAYGFASFPDGLDACRRILRRGATPAVLRLYDAIEGDRHFGTGDAVHPLLVLDEGEPAIIDPVMHLVEEECEAAQHLDPELVGHWLERRNDVSALEHNIRRGAVVDTMEIAAPWSDLPRVYERAIAAITAVEGTVIVSAHQSHAYSDGACLYFTFGGLAEPDRRDEYYVAAWDAGTRAVLAEGGALSHHHGVGLNRARFVHDALGGGYEVLVAVKHALDPHGVLNPGKLGLPDPYGEPGWP